MADEMHYQKLLAEGWPPEYVDELRRKETTAGEEYQARLGDYSPEAKEPSFYEEEGTWNKLKNLLTTDETWDPGFLSPDYVPPLPKIPKKEGPEEMVIPPSLTPKEPYDPRSMEGALDKDSIRELAAQKKMTEWEDDLASRAYQPKGYRERLGANVQGENIGRAGVPGEFSGYRPVTKERAQKIQMMEGKLSPTTEQYRNSNVRRNAAGDVVERQSRRISRGGGVGDAAWRAEKLGQTGAFTPSAPIPTSGADTSWVMETQSPAVQRIWAQRKLEEFGLDKMAAETKSAQAAADVARVEADVAMMTPQQQIQRYIDQVSMLPQAMKSLVDESPEFKDQVEQMYSLILVKNPEWKGNKQQEAMARMSARTLAYQKFMTNLSQMMGMWLQMASGMTPRTSAAVAGKRDDMGGYLSAALLTPGQEE